MNVDGVGLIYAAVLAGVCPGFRRTGWAKENIIECTTPRTSCVRPLLCPTPLHTLDTPQRLSAEGDRPLGSFLSGLFPSSCIPRSGDVLLRLKC